MVVNSLSFLLFFAIVFLIYYSPIMQCCAKKQNLWLLITSYLFYGITDLRMIPLLIITTLIFYLIGLWLNKYVEKENWKSAYRITTLGVCMGGGVLIYFKYLGFFVESFASFLNSIGFQVSWSTLHIILPIGVSFFTFKLISYVVDIYREKIKATEDLVEFATYIAFFPTILSGPIDRPNKFIPQLLKERTFNYDIAVQGCRQILWGMFTKMCIADNIATVTDKIWINPDNYSGVSLIIVALMYPLQMYADFDGYSNMAIGVGKLLGIDVARNFNHPFLARNIAEYWRNWHISLTSWLTDYVFSPLNIAFRKMKTFGVILATLINFVLIGFWHGSNWTFGLFGLYHGLLYIPLIIEGNIGKRNKLKPNSFGFPTIHDLSKMVLTYILVAFGLILFRAPSLDMFISYVRILFDVVNYNPNEWMMIFSDMRYYAVIFAFIMLMMEWTCRNKKFNLEFSKGSRLASSTILRWSLYVILIITTLSLRGTDAQFIYFQF